MVAYQVGWFLFLAPYGIIAQPIHTTILPELVEEHGAWGHHGVRAFAALGVGLDDGAAGARSVRCAWRWRCRRCRCWRSVQASGTQSVDLLAAALASLGRRPAALRHVLPAGPGVLRARGVPRSLRCGVRGASLVGVVIMLVGRQPRRRAPTTVLALGLAHSVSFLIGCVALVVTLHRRIGALGRAGRPARLRAGGHGGGQRSPGRCTRRGRPQGRGLRRRRPARCSCRWSARSTWVAPAARASRSPDGCPTAGEAGQAPRKELGHEDPHGCCAAGGGRVAVWSWLAPAQAATELRGGLRRASPRHRGAGAGVHRADAVVGATSSASTHRTCEGLLGRIGGRRPVGAVGESPHLGRRRLRDPQRRHTGRGHPAGLARVRGRADPGHRRRPHEPARGGLRPRAGERGRRRRTGVPRRPPTRPTRATLAPEAGENYDGSPAAEEFARRTGVLPQVGQVFNFGLVSMRDLNSKLLFDAEIGALGDALSESGVDACGHRQR